MATSTRIEWTESTWNPVTGCTKVTPGCTNCYAHTLTERFRGTPGHHFETGFDLTLRPNALTVPLRWRKPRKVFVNSMSDLFHQDIPDEYIARVFAVMALTPRHTYQLLTKRHGRMRALLGGQCDCGAGHAPGEHFRSAMAWAVSVDNPDRIPGAPDDAEKRVYHDTAWPLPNLWLGVSVEDQQRADLRIPHLLQTPAAVHFLSCEPLLGPIDLWGPLVPGRGRPKLTYWLSGRPGWGPEQTDERGRIFQQLAVGPRIDWVIAGGESGPGARPMHTDWARTLRDQCQHSGVPFLFKQHGEYVCATVEDDPQFAGGRAYDDPRGGRRAAVIREPGSSGTFRSATTRALRPGERTSGGVQLLDTDTVALRVGKKTAGRLLDGRTWDEFPEASA